MVELPRLRLPLPERTGSDRDELLSPHGFVDRAYSVFLLRCVSLLRTSHCIYRATVGASIPPLSCYSPDAGSHLRALLHRGVNEGTSPRAHPRPLLLRLRYDVPCLERPAGNCLGGGPEGRAPMEVPDLRASRPNDWNPTPPARSPTTWACDSSSVTTRIRGSGKAGCVPIVEHSAAVPCARHQFVVRQGLSAPAMMTSAGRTWA